MFHRSFTKVLLGLIVTISLLAVIGLFFMGGLRSHGGSPIVWRYHPRVEVPNEGVEAEALPPTFYGGRRASILPVFCGAGLLLLGLPLALLVAGGLFLRHRRRSAGWGPCGPKGGKEWSRHSGRGHPWPWEEGELSEEEMARMKRWHQRHGFKPPWNEGQYEESKQAPEKPEDEPR